MSESSIDIHNPTFGRPASDAARQSLPLPRKVDGDRLTIAFIDNEKPNTTRLLDLVEEGLASRYQVDVQHLFKGGAAHPAPEAVIHAAAGSDLVVSATGD